MKKVLGVALVGGLLLVIAMWAVGREQKGPSASAGPAASVTAPVTAALPTAIVPIVPPQPAAPVASTGPSAPTDSAACAQLAGLCSTSDEKVDVGECEKKLADARKMSGASNVERSTSCIAGATTCAAASGCLSGGVGMGAVGEFLKGLGSSLSR